MCKGYYSPRIRADLLKRLYFKRKQMKIPMTRLVDHLIEDGLERMEIQPLSSLFIRKVSYEVRNRLIRQEADDEEKEAGKVFDYHAPT